jgi:hypothetical protein
MGKVVACARRLASVNTLLTLPEHILINGTANAGMTFRYERDCGYMRPHA